jgi:hypothetical protein
MNLDHSPHDVDLRQNDANKAETPKCKQCLARFAGPFNSPTPKSVMVLELLL